nr:PIR protein, putative [Plasmodium sp. DRC-Itaito]
MEVHYINYINILLLFALPLNLLINDQRNHKSTTPRHTKTNRTLCECELYAPSNYDNDPEMKKVMQQFDDRTSQRFHEYDDRMVEKRKRCKDQCDKEIQKIILKDKLEKEFMDKFATLDTDIQSDAIPTCICEKSIVDKVEKGCLRCGGVLGGGVAPGWGLISGLGYAAWTNYAATTLVEIATDAGIKAGVKYGIQELKDFSSIGKLIGFSKIKNLINSANYDNGMIYVNFIQKIKTSMCDGSQNTAATFCKAASYQRTDMFLQGASRIARDAKYSAELAEKQVLDAATPVTNALTTVITASVIAIVVIIMIMVIIYLILRYRRKKKMKKKLQYIKLLKE